MCHTRTFPRKEEDTSQIFTQLSWTLLGFIVFFSVLAVNWILEKTGIATGEEEEANLTWMKVVHSTIFPLALKRQTKRAFWSRYLQIMSGNMAIFVLGYSVAIGAGITEKLFMTENMVKALGVMALVLILHSVLASLQFHKPPANQLSSDLEEADDDPTEETPLLNNHSEREASPNSTKKAAFTIFLTSSLVLTLASPYPLLLNVFNSCPTLNSSQYSNITCTSRSPTVGSQCSVSCSPLYWSSTFPHSTCTWRGVWSEQLGCMTQVAAVLGPGTTNMVDNYRAALEIYPSSHNLSILPPLPKDYEDGSTGYISGGLQHCGGFDDEDPSVFPTSSCYHLIPPLLQWEETFPLLQVT